MAGPYGQPVVSLQEAAAAFVPFADGSTADEVEAYLRYVGKAGSGLYQLLQKTEAVGPVFRAIYNLGMLSEMSVANKENCQRVNVLGEEVLVVLDIAGRRGAAVRDIGLEALAACFEDICRIVDTFCQPGWLLRLACDERLKEEYDTLHQAVIELIKGEGLTSLPGVRTPATPDYRDLGRQLRRMLKQLGSGNLSAGVQQLQESEKARYEVTRLLDVTIERLQEELAQIPESGLELHTLYRQLMQPTTALSRLTQGGVAGDGGCSVAAAGSIAEDAEAGTAASAAVVAAELGCTDGTSSSVSSALGTTLYSELFRWYDRNKSGALEREELQAALADLGMLDGKSTAEARELTTSYMRMADAAAVAQGEGMGFEVFCKFYEMLVTTIARQQLRVKLGLEVEESLHTAFLSFASFGSREVVTEMDGAHFQKLCKDCGLLDKRTGTSEADLIFCSVKTKGMRRITFEQFLTALSRLSERKAAAFEDIVMQVLSSGPVANNATQTEIVRLHDDKSSYTGMYARRGPSPTDQAAVLDLSLVVDRSLPEAAKRGAGCPISPSPHRCSRSNSYHASPSCSNTVSRSNSLGDTNPLGGASPGLAVIRSSSRSTSGILDIAAAPGICPPISHSSSNRRMSAGNAGYQGSGSSTSRRCSRDATVTASGSTSGSSSRTGRSPSGTGGNFPGNVAGLLCRQSKLCTDAPASLKDVFSAFAGFGIRSSALLSVPVSSSSRGQLGPAGVFRPLVHEMDGFRFVKLCREAGFFDSQFTSTKADLIFTKVKTKGAKKITFMQFINALDLIATEKRVSLQQLVDHLMECGGPGLNTALVSDSTRVLDSR